MEKAFNKKLIMYHKQSMLALNALSDPSSCTLFLFRSPFHIGFFVWFFSIGANSCLCGFRKLSRHPPVNWLIRGLVFVPKKDLRVWGFVYFLFFDTQLALASIERSTRIGSEIKTGTNKDCVHVMGFWTFLRLFFLYVVIEICYINILHLYYSKI